MVNEEHFNEKNNDNKIYLKIEVGWGVNINYFCNDNLYINWILSVSQNGSIIYTHFRNCSRHFSFYNKCNLIALVSLINEITTLKKYTQFNVELIVLSFKTMVLTGNVHDYSKMQAFELTEHLDSVIFNIAYKINK